MPAIYYTIPVHFCDLTFESPAENLACDEALLDWCDAGQAAEILRVWEPSKAFVVLGYANRAASEANLSFCQKNNIPVHRRCTGGGAVLQEVGVLNYSLILRTAGNGPYHSIGATNNFVMQRHRAACAELLNAPVEIKGHTDLAIKDVKFCGNAQRRKKNYLLFHGSFLLRADIDLIERALSIPSKQPDYRKGRSHSGFLMNLNVDSAKVKTILQDTWRACAKPCELPLDQVSRLAQGKYSRDDWNFKF